MTRWTAYREPSGARSEHAIRLLDEAGRATHTVARVKLPDGWKYEAWRLAPGMRSTLIAVSTDPAEAKRRCEADQRRAVA